jgi:hypothetical protein
VLVPRRSSSETGGRSKTVRRTQVNGRWSRWQIERDREGWGRHVLSDACRPSPGTSSEQLTPVLRAANATLDHVVALEKAAGDPLTNTFWIEAAFGGGDADPFADQGAGEGIEISQGDPALRPPNGLGRGASPHVARASRTRRADVRRRARLAAGPISSAARGRRRPSRAAE